MGDAMEVDEPEVLEAAGLEKGKGKGKEPAADFVEKETDNLPWVEKYRPTHLNELISHQDIISTITRFIDEGRLPHLLFYGPPGTGKTSTILACARKLYGSRYKSMALELNASDERGIDVVREQIKNFASTKQIFSSGFKLIILDEADAMTTTAQAALRRVIEKYTRNVRFCIICNYVNKIIPAVQSRCTRFRFAPLKEDQIRLRMDHVIQNEGIIITEDARTALQKLSMGDMRRALNILQATHAAFNPITESSVYLCTGSPLPSDIKQIVEWLFNEDFATAYTSIQALRVQHGLAMADIITEVHETLPLIDLPAPVRVMLLDKLAELEHNLSTGCTEKAQLAALVGIFKLSLDLVEKLSQPAF
ncbi:hypothetical protein HKX48_001055 [Thoreauomyces humboldtii]|nr:hypothetical protein HKX48_001055 [Thoreauomyces humboldtii]